MTNLIYYVASTTEQIINHDKNETIGSRARRWAKEINIKPGASNDPPHIDALAARNEAVKTVAQSYLLLTFGLFGLAMLATALAPVIGRVPLTTLTVAILIATNLGFVLQVKHQIIASQFNNWRLMTPAERTTQRISKLSNPSNLDLLLALPGFMFFALVLWGR